MKQYYSVSGTLNRGFVGQISYSVCLDKSYDSLDIFFTFDKQHFDTITDEVRTEFCDACMNGYPEVYNSFSQDDITEQIRASKTEIHVIASMNGHFIGGVHKQLTERHLLFSAGTASEGCIPQPAIEGVLHITLVVFNVILDDTHYGLSVNVK